MEPDVTSRMRKVAPMAALASCAALALAGLVLLIVQSRAGSAASPAPARMTATATGPGDGPADVAVSPVCSLANGDATAAHIQGADGGQSLVVGGRSWWLFGDTLFLPSSGKQIEPNAIASSSSAGDGGCPRLTYFARNGTGVPFLAKDGSLTVWPAGAYAVDDHTFDVYTVYVYGSGPYAYWIGEVGLARVDTRTMQVTTLARSLWTASSGFEDQPISATPADVSNGYLRVVIETELGDHLLARVRPDAMADASAYEYWDGQAWQREASRARPMWPHEHATDALRKLATFDSGESIAYNAYLRKYTAVVNVGVNAIGARVADRIEGPWSAPVTWIDCTKISQPALPSCYSPSQHPELATDGGREIFLTFTRMGTYDVMAYRVELGSPGGANGG